MMASDPPISAATLEKFRSYLRILARSHLDPRLRGKLDASDIVQDVMVKAVQSLDGFRGQNDTELAAWLRRILANHLANKVRDLGRAKRDVGRNHSLEAAIDQSSVRLENWLAAEQSTPSVRAVFNEQLLLLAAAIDRLPDSQREALTLHHLHQWKLEAIAQHMNKSMVAVAGLIKRGLRQLREQLGPPTSTG